MGLDKFYTKPEIVDFCIDKINFSKYKTIIEPSAGNGAFSNEIECLAYDILPEHSNIIEQDFLTLELNQSKTPLLIVGNPPFGRQNSLALKFIKRSCKYCDCFAFILPLSFRKQSVKNKIPLFFHLMSEFILPKNSFTSNGVDYNVPCVFQIWEKQSKTRIIPKNIKNSKYFKFVKKNENPEFSIRRVGFYAGKLSKDINKNESTHYFIKVLDDIFFDIWDKIDFSKENTVGPRSISKQEIYIELNSGGLNV